MLSGFQCVVIPALVTGVVKKTDILRSAFYEFFLCVFLSDPGPIIVYPSQWLTHWLTDSQTCWRFNELTFADGIKYLSDVDIEMKLRFSCHQLVYAEYAEYAEHAESVKYAEYAKYTKFANQTYQTKPTKQNLPNQTYHTKPSKPNLPNQNYQTKHNNPSIPEQTYKIKQTWICFFLIFSICEH